MLFLIFPNYYTYFTWHFNYLNKKQKGKRSSNHLYISSKVYNHASAILGSCNYFRWVNWGGGVLLWYFSQWWYIWLHNYLDPSTWKSDEWVMILVYQQFVWNTLNYLFRVGLQCTICLHDGTVTGLSSNASLIPQQGDGGSNSCRGADLNIYYLHLLIFWNKLKVKDRERGMIVCKYFWFQMFSQSPDRGRCAMLQGGT